MIVGLSGKKETGKDTVAQYLVDEYGFQRRAFADKLKEAALKVDPLVDVGTLGLIHLSEAHGVLDWDRLKGHHSVRKFLQDVGLVARQYFGEDVWVKPVMEGLEDDVDYVISDVRFPNEYEAIRERGGEMWRVERITPSSVIADIHPSEIALDEYEFDFVLKNQGLFDDLYGRIDDRMLALRPPQKEARKTGEMMRSVWPARAGEANKALDEDDA